MLGDLLVCHLARVEYREALDLQEQLRARVQAGELADVLLLLEHPPVYTLGRRSDPGDLPMGESWYRSQGVDVVRTRRGGKLTYHGPGQLVGYPIVRVHDVPGHVGSMEEALVRALAEEGVEARGRSAEGPQWSGVWAGERKIASVGVHVSRGVSMHGFAVNVDGDLQPWEWVVACGLPTTRMTSIFRETGRAGQMRCFRRRVAYAYAQALGRRQRLVSRARLLEGPRAPAVRP